MNPDNPHDGVPQVFPNQRSGDELDSNRIARIPRNHGEKRGKRGRRSKGKVARKRARTKRRVLFTWTIVISIATLATLGTFFVIWVWPYLDRAMVTTETDRQAVEGRVRKIPKFKPPGENETLALATKALAARTPAEVDALIRRGPYSHDEVIRLLTALPTTDGPIIEQSWLGGIDRNGLQIEGVEVDFGDSEHPKPRLVALTPDERGIWKMDFPAFTRLVEPAWDKLLADPDIKAAVVRVILVPDNYYNIPFASEAEWEAYSMVSQDIEKLLVGYCKRGSPQHRALRAAIRGGEAPVIRMTLEIRRVEGAAPRQFEISRVLAEGWIMGEEAFDEVLAGGR
jgi:hypothetical protein